MRRPDGPVARPHRPNPAPVPWEAPGPLRARQNVPPPAESLPLFEAEALLRMAALAGTRPSHGFESPDPGASWPQGPAPGHSRSAHSGRAWRSRRSPATA